MPKIGRHGRQFWIDKFQILVDQMKKEPSQTPEGLSAMALVLQDTFCDREVREDIPHADALESLMRVVIHCIEGDPIDPAYIQEKLNVAMGCFERRLLLLPPEKKS